MGAPQTSDRNPLMSQILKVDSHREQERPALEGLPLVSLLIAGLSPDNSATDAVASRDEGKERIICASSSRALGHPSPSRLTLASAMFVRPLVGTGRWWE